MSGPFTQRMQAEYDQAWESAGMFDHPMHKLYATTLQKWARMCFRDPEIFIFVLNTITAHHPDQNSVRAFRAWYEFSSPYHVPLPRKEILIPDIISEILKENNNELFQRYQHYRQILDASVE